jgi:hypothetical protein
MQLCVSVAESYLEAARIRSPDRWRCARNRRHRIPFPSCRWPPLTGGRHTEKGDETDANSSNSIHSVTRTQTPKALVEDD